MKSSVFVLLIALTGCISFTDARLEYSRLAPSAGRRYYVQEIKFSDKAASIPVGEEAHPSVRCAKIREQLCKNAGDVFSLNPERAIPLQITIHAYKNAASKNAGVVALDDNGVSKSFMLLQRFKHWNLIYEIKCEIEDHDSKRCISKNINSCGLSKEGIFFPEAVFLLFLPFADDLHFDGIAPFYGMADGYDWLVEKEFAEVMKSAVAEFELGQ